MRVLLCLWLLIGAAYAQPAPREEARAAAARAAAEGQRLYEAGRYGPALQRFEEARRLYPSPDLSVYIAASLLSLQRDHEAAGALLEFFPEASRTPEALRALSLRIWQETSREARRDLLGRAGERLRPEARRRLLASDPRTLPEELRGLKAPDPPVVAPAAPAPPRAAEVRRPRPLWPGVALGAAGVVTLGVGAALLALHDRCATPGTLDSCDEVYRTQAGGATAAALGGAALLAGGAWLVLRLRR